MKKREEQWAEFMAAKGEYLTRGPDKNGETALHQAASGGYQHVVGELISQGHDINARNHYGESVMERAVAPLRTPEGNERAIQRTLLDAGVELQGNNKAGQNLVHVAAAVGDGPMCKFLVEDGGLNINAADSRGYTPLHMSASLSGEAVGDLLALGADPSIRNHDHKTPRDVALSTTARTELDNHARVQSLKDLHIPDPRTALANMAAQCSAMPEVSKARKL